MWITNFILKKQPFIADAAPLLSNQFRVKMSAGDIIPISTDLFLESIQNNFIDSTVPVMVRCAQAEREPSTKSVHRANCKIFFIDD